MNTDSRRRKGRYNAVAIHDGQAWHLLSGSELKERIAPIAGPANRLPQALVDQAAAAQSRSVRFLFADGVHRMEGAIPGGMSLDRANEVIRASVAEETGAETDGLVVAGLSMSWGGVRKPFTLAGTCDGGVAEEFHAALDEAGIVCAGFASLELAMLAVWRNRLDGRDAVYRDREGRTAARPARTASLVIVGSGSSFIVPAPRPANPGPQTAPCGMRHFAMDPANWLSRFQRGTSAIGKEAPVHVAVMPESRSDVVAALVSAGYADVIAESRDAWLEAAARAVLLDKPNRVRGVAVPVANPYEPRKRFPNRWLLLVAAAVLALPALFRWACVAQTDRTCAALTAESVKYIPVEDRIKKAQKALASARAQLAAETAYRKRMVGMRRPLVAFVDVAYFFCKHAGRSLTLDAIEQKGDRIEVRGTFTDPEDGVRLNDGLLAYAKGRGIEIVKNESAHEEGGDRAFVNRFSVVLDCAKVGEAAK